MVKVKKKKNYLITGGIGFIGKAISKLLIDKGHKVKIVDVNFRNKKNPIINKNIEYFNVDISGRNV